MREKMPRHFHIGIQNNPKPKAYAVWNNLDRRISSSGGAFSSFARKTIANGGIVLEQLLMKDYIATI